MFRLSGLGFGVLGLAGYSCSGFLLRSLDEVTIICVYSE